MGFDFMEYKIYKWNEIEKYYENGSLLLGNGASMAVDKRFGYQSLIEHAKDHGLLPDDVYLLFDFFNTNDFELILRLVWQASNVNRSLGILDEKTYAAYIRVRECLINTVRSIHPQHFEINHDFMPIYEFLKKFKTVISLNYDLIVYWSIMHGNELRDWHSVKDCFNKQRFEQNWKRYRVPIRLDKSTTLVFYPHGNLILSRDKVESEFKLSNVEGSLLESILNAWQSEQCVPLFVCEGESLQKIKSIESSNYLNTVYREVYKDVGRKLVVYGWGVGKQDEYILKRLASSEIENIAVSVYGRNQDYCNRVIHAIYENISPGRVRVEFFDSESEGCWNN